MKQVARRVLGATPVQAVMRRRALADDPVTVLCYHTLGPDQGGPDAWTVLRVGDFRAHLAMLAEGYQIISLDEAMVQGPARPAGGKPRAVLTFDDGESGLFRHLLPVLEEARVPVLVYVATAQIESGQPYWFDRVINALGEGSSRVDLPALGVWELPAAAGETRWAVLGGLLDTLKTVASEQREDFTNCIVATHSLPAGRAPLAPLTRAELATLAASQWVTIGAHSHCHNLLDQLVVTKAVESMARSRALLRSWTGQAVEHFAWPNGNHTKALRKEAAGLGFRTAAALDGDGALWRQGADLWALPRVAVGRYDSATRFRLRIIRA